MSKFTAPFKATIDTLTRNIVPYFRIQDPYVGFLNKGRIIAFGGTKAVIKNVFSDLFFPVFSIFKCAGLIILGVIDIIELLVRTIYIPVALISDYKGDDRKFNKTILNLLTMLCCVLHCLELPINIAALALGNLILPIKILGRTIATIHHYKVKSEEEAERSIQLVLDPIDTDNLSKKGEEADSFPFLPWAVGLEILAQKAVQYSSTNRLSR